MLAHCIPLSGSSIEKSERSRQQQRAKTEAGARGWERGLDLYCFLMCSSKGFDWKWNLWDLSQHPWEVPLSIHSSFVHFTTVLAPGIGILEHVGSVREPKWRGGQSGQGTAAKERGADTLTERPEAFFPPMSVFRYPGCRSSCPSEAVSCILSSILHNFNWVCFPSSCKIFTREKHG